MLERLRHPSELRECFGLGHLVVLLAGGGVALIRLLDGFRRGLARRQVLYVDDDLAARQVVQAHRARVGRPLVHVAPTDVLLPPRLPGLDHEAVIRTGDAAVVLPPPLPERPFDALYPAFRQIPPARAGRALCGRRDEARDAAVLAVDAVADGLGLLRGELSAAIRIERVGGEGQVGHASSTQRDRTSDS